MVVFHITTQESEKEFTTTQPTNMKQGHVNQESVQILVTSTLGLKVD